MSERHRLNELLRAVDWRFLLRRAERPRALVLSAPRAMREGLALVSDPAEAGQADLVVIGFPTRRRLRRARAALAAGGEVACLWRVPRIAGTRRARARLRRAGLERVSLHWPGPDPRRPPEFWLPLGSPAAASYLFAQRPPRSPVEAALRRLWRVAERTGVLAPICALGGEGAAGSAGDQIEAILADAEALVLLTEGVHSSGKVIGIPFGPHGPGRFVVKLGRRDGAEASLRREHTTLRRLAAERPHLPGVPTSVGIARVAGGLATAQTAVHGKPLNARLREDTLSQIAPRVTERLVELAAAPHPEPDPRWRRRLVEEPLDRFEQLYGERLAAGALARARRELAALPELPPTWEHRDCGVWNVAVGAGGEIVIHDWEFAEPRGLPSCDLAFFLATAAFEADRVLADGAPDPSPIWASHTRLLERGSAAGRIAAACSARYGEALGIGLRDLERLRLLAWIAQILANPSAATNPEPSAPDSLRPGVLVGFIEAEIAHLR